MFEPTPANDTEVRSIRLTHGLETLVDAADFERLSAKKWYPMQRRRSGKFYVVDCKGVPMHRLILGCIRGEVSDHINGNTLDNRRSNLRKATPSQNSQNAAIHADNKAGYKGVHWDARWRRWCASIWVKGRGRVHLGSFDSQIEAAKSYDEGAKRHFGAFAKPNFA